MTTRISRRSRAVALATTIVAITLGVTVPPALGAVGAVQATLTVDDGTIVNRCKVTVKGRVSMTQAEAQDFLDRRYYVQIRLWGDDLFSDDLVAGPYTLFGPASEEIGADPTGLRFEKSAQVLASKLDEDHEFAGAIDEVYATVRLLHPAGSTVRAGKSNYRYREWFGGNC